MEEKFCRACQKHAPQNAIVHGDFFGEAHKSEFVLQIYGQETGRKL